MKYTLTFVYLFLLSCFALHAQTDKYRIAIFDPVALGTGMDEGTGTTVREIITSAFANTGKYTFVERSWINRVLDEQAFSVEESEDDSQIAEIGRLIGADKVAVSMIRLTGGRNMVNLKLIDVQSASVERQKTQVVASSGLFDAVEYLAMGLTGEAGVYADASEQPTGLYYNHVKVTVPDGDMEIEMAFVEGSGRIQSFYIGRFEITQAQWEALMEENPSQSKGDAKPVENVTWDETQTFIERLNALTGRQFRLPDENEWLYAARGGKNGDNYRFAGSNSLVEVAWYKEAWSKREAGAHEVGIKKPNSLGIHDMTGNVWEWCQNENRTILKTGSKGHIIRGGGWNSDAVICQLRQSRSSSTGNDDTIGFRIALSE